MLKAMDKFIKWSENRHEYAKDWKERTGGKLAGYFCSYLPEEIYYAANVLPVRIFGGHESTGLTEPYVLSNISCSFCRDCLGQGLKGAYSYLDGLTMAQTCVHTGSIYWIWKNHIPMEWSRFVSIPLGTQSVGRFEFLKKEMIKLKISLEEWTGRTIADEDLDKAIEVYNLNRKLCRQVYEYRKLPDPPITGEDALNIVMSSQLVDKKEHNEALKELLEELPTYKPQRETGTRLMLVGSVLDDPRFMRMVEAELNMPATFVTEDTCTGLRYFFNDVTPQKDRYMALSIRYNHRPPCPIKDWPSRRRFPYILNLLKQYNVKVVILMNQKWCHPHIYDNVPLSKKLREMGITTTNVELEVTLNKGQYKTNLEATLETTMDFA